MDRRGEGIEKQLLEWLLKWFWFEIIAERVTKRPLATGARPDFSFFTLSKRKGLDGSSSYRSFTRYPNHENPLLANLDSVRWHHSSGIPRDCARHNGSRALRAMCEQ
jgi:hypothetical protein